MFRLLVRSLVVVAALAILFVTPVWTETSAGFGVVPVWWPESAPGRSLILTGVLLDGLAVVALLVAVLWPRLMRR